MVMGQRATAPSQYLLAQADRIEEVLTTLLSTAERPAYVLVDHIIQGARIAQMTVYHPDFIQPEQIIAHEAQIARAARVPGCRVVTHGTEVWIELPAPTPHPVPLEYLLRQAAYDSHDGQLLVPLGETPRRDVVSLDLAAATTHGLLMIGGQRSGKTMTLAAIAGGLCRRYPASRVRLAIVDPKGAEPFDPFTYSAHLLHPVVQSPGEALQVLEAFSAELQRRTERQRRLHLVPNCHWVLILDDVETVLEADDMAKYWLDRLLSQGYSQRIHVLVSTAHPESLPSGLPQRLPVHIAGRLSNDQIRQAPEWYQWIGADRLLGAGDLLVSPGSEEVFRVQGAYVDLDFAVPLATAPIPMLDAAAIQQLSTRHRKAVPFSRALVPMPGQTPDHARMSAATIATAASSRRATSLEPPAETLVPASFRLSHLFLVLLSALTLLALGGAFAFLVPH
jgi:hypothetical protein